MQTEANGEEDEDVTSDNTSSEEEENTSSDESKDMVGELPDPNLLSFDEKQIKVTILLENDKTLTYMLKELKDVFKKKEPHCLLEIRYFLKWDTIISKHQALVQQNQDRAVRMNAEKEINSFKMTFNADEETFKLVMKYFKRQLYPFNISAEKRKKFNEFMLKYVIDEKFLWDKYQLYPVSSMFLDKPNLSKY